MVFNRACWVLIVLSSWTASLTISTTTDSPLRSATSVILKVGIISPVIWVLTFIVRYPDL